jgi:nucleotide-binding universal stress UspA family protein
VEGTVSSELVRLVREHDPRLLVTGSAARRPLDRILQGSVSAELVHRAGCPVVVVPDDAELEADGPLVAAYDGSEHSLRAARHGAALAARLGRDLVLVHVAAPDEPSVEVDAALARDLHAAAAPGAARRLDVAVAIERGDPVEMLAQACRERSASFVVVGSRGRNAVSAAILGSVSAGMVRTAGRPVVVAGPESGDPHT